MSCAGEGYAEIGDFRVQDDYTYKDQRTISVLAEIVDKRRGGD